MEKLISSDERIKRAEDIYYRRRGASSYNSSEEEYKINFKSFKRMIKISIFFMLIYIVFCIVQNRNYIFTEQFMSDVNRVFTVELGKKITEISNYFNDDNVNNIEQNKQESNNKESTQDTQYIEATLSTAEDISSVDQIRLDADEINNKTNIIKPLDGVITSEFGVRSLSNINVSGYHTGLDIAANMGETIISAIDGTVDSISEYGAYGKHIVIKKDNITTMYAHCSKICVNVGDEITQGSKIAEVGSTGNSTGPHLHFELMLDDRYVDPAYLLEY